MSAHAQCIPVSNGINSRWSSLLIFSSHLNPVLCSIPVVFRLHFCSTLLLCYAFSIFMCIFSFHVAGQLIIYATKLICTIYSNVTPNHPKSNWKLCMQTHEFLFVSHLTMCLHILSIYWMAKSECMWVCACVILIPFSLCVCLSTHFIK